MMQIIDLFSGIAGFSFAGRWMGWRPVQFCEIDKFCQKVIAYHFPGAPIHDDIKTLTAELIINNGHYDPNETTILCGGPPCQPVSIAGKRKGKEDDRWLWGEAIRAVREIKPAYCIFENPPGILSMDHGKLFKEILSALENEGYEIECFIIPACSKGAPHRRYRVWIIAYSDRFRCNNEQKENRESLCNKERNGQIKKQEWREFQCGISKCVSSSDTGSKYSNIPIQQRRQNEAKNFDTDRENAGGITADPNSSVGCERRMHQNESEEAKRYVSSCDAQNNQRQTWDDFPTVSPICQRNDGLSSRLSGITFPKWRNEGIKALGNAVVPELVFDFFKTIQEYENRK